MAGAGAQAGERRGRLLAGTSYGATALPPVGVGALSPHGSTAQIINTLDTALFYGSHLLLSEREARCRVLLIGIDAGRSEKTLAGGIGIKTPIICSIMRP